MKDHWLTVLGLAVLTPLCLRAFAGAPAAQAAPSAAQEGAATLRLEQALRLALERSPERKSAQAAVAALEHRAVQARALPDPTLTVGWAGKPIPMVTMPGDPSSYRGLTLMEQFTYPGKLRLQEAIALRDVNGARAECEAATRRVTLQVKLAYAEYAYADQALAAVRQNKALQEKLAAIAEAQYRVGRAMQQDVLRAQLEISLTLERIEQLKLQRDNALAELYAAMQQPQEDSPPLVELSASAQPLRYTLDEMYTLAEANDTGLSKAQSALERGALSVALAERQYRPDIGVGYMYQQRTEMPDMHGVTVTVSLPAFWKSKQREAVAEAVANQRGAEAMQSNQRNAVRAEVRKQWLAIASADRLLNLYADAITPQTALTFESALASYQVGRLDFQSLLANVSTQLEYKINIARRLADRQQAIARMENLTGQSITTVDQAATDDAEKETQKQ